MQTKSSLRLLILMWLMQAVATYADGPAPVRFGSVAEDIPAVMHKRLTPLTDYLARAIGRPVVLNLSTNMTAAIDAISDGDVDLAYLTPVAYLRAHEAGDVRLIAKVITSDRPYFHLQIIVRDDSSIREVKDLVGKKFAFGDPAAVMQQAVVSNAGIALEKLGKRGYLGHYDNVVRSVLNRDYDAGIFPDNKTLKWKNRGIRVIHTSPELQPFNISAASNMDRHLYDKLRTALLSLNNDNAEHRHVLDSMGAEINGFAPATDADYDVIRELVGPFMH